MDDRAKAELFENAPVPKAVMTMAIPTIISSLVMVIYNLADTYFVGMLDNPVQNAAVTLAAPVLLAFNAVNNLFGVGSSSMMSRALGQKKYDVVRSSSAFGFWCALCSGLLFSLACTLFHSPLLVVLGADQATSQATGEYLLWTVSCGAAPAILNVVMAYLVRSEGSALHASIGTMSGCLLNIVLDPIFILPQGLGMGAAGAGFATFLSNCFACLYFFVLLFIKRKNTYISLSPRQLRFDRGIVMGVCAVGIPSAIQNLLNVTGMTVLNNFTSLHGPDAVAAMGISQKINQVPLYISLGLSQGIMPLISYNYGSGNVSRLKAKIHIKIFCYSSRISIGVITAIAASYYLWSANLVSLFMENATIVAYGSRFLRGMCLGLPFLCMDFLAVGVFQACGLGKKALLFAILRKIVLEIPALYILGTLFPLYGLAYAQFTAEVVLATAAIIVLTRIFRGLEEQESPLC